MASGEAPVGIVYATDAAAEPAVRVVADFPDVERFSLDAIARAYCADELWLSRLGFENGSLVAAKLLARANAK